MTTQKDVEKKAVVIIGDNIPEFSRKDGVK
jgi:hypothetical protein